MSEGWKNITMDEQQAILKQAIMQVKPEYFSWSLEQQEKYGVDIPDEDDFRIQQILVKEIFGIKVDNDQQLDKFMKDVWEPGWTVLYSTMTPLVGIGTNHFFLNEPGNILRYDTLADYAIRDHKHQESCRLRDDPAYIKRPYRGEIETAGARFIVEGKFSYASLTSLAEWLKETFEQFGDDLIEELIPSYREECPPNEDYVSWMFKTEKIVLDGKEAQLEELQHRFLLYCRKNRYDELLDEFDNRAESCVYILPHPNGTEFSSEPDCEFIFSDKSALKAVQFRHFWDNCKAIEGDIEHLKMYEEREKLAVRQFIESAYRDIMIQR